jgi:hypothetical protein
MATKKQIDANRENSHKSPGPRDTNKTRENATKHALYSNRITDLDRAEGLEEVEAKLIAELKPIGVLEHHRVHCMALDLIRQRRTQRLESEFIEKSLRPRFPDAPADHNSPSPLEVEYRIPSHIVPIMLEHVVTKYHRCEAFYANDLLRNERDLERLQRIRAGEHLPLPVAVSMRFDAKPQVVEPMPTVTGSNTYVPLGPTIMSNESEVNQDRSEHNERRPCDVSATFTPDVRKRKSAPVGEDGHASVSPLVEVEIAPAGGPTEDPLGDMKELSGSKPNDAPTVIAPSQKLVSQQTPNPAAPWQNIVPRPHWMTENETKPISTSGVGLDRNENVPAANRSE